MIRSLIQIIALFLVLSMASSCEKLLLQPDHTDTPMNNFQVLWETLDRKYSFFTYKNVDWDSVYNIYHPEIHEELHDSSLFRILGEMLLSLADIHTDLWGDYGSIQYDLTDMYPRNFSLLNLELEYFSASAGFQEGIRYEVIDSIAYMYINNFATEISDAGFRKIINELGDVRGYIIDVRDNEGGNSRNALVVANHFFDSSRLVRINHYKTGPGHDDFSPVNQYISPGDNPGINKQTVILTNRYCFSAANTFVGWMSLLPHVELIGDTTGGGGGTPFFSELPNGWKYRFSATQSFLPDGLNLDKGVPPDFLVNQTRSDSKKHKDSILEFALNLIRTRIKSDPAP